MTAILDQSMPWLDIALDTHLAEEMLRRSISLDGIAADSLALRSAKLLRHRAGRRAVVEYTIDVFAEDARQTTSLVGKTRAKGLDRETVRVISALRDAGFDDRSLDRISVPAIAGVIPEWRMWLSQRIEGDVLTDFLDGCDRMIAARRVADAAWKIHQSGVSARKIHTLTDEIVLLKSALDQASAMRPELSARIENVGEACRCVADSTPPGLAGCVHRDFYADQIVVAGERLFVLDFDLFSAGDFELDIGNFIAHLTEQSIRLDGDPVSMGDMRRAVVDRAVERGASEDVIDTYDLLTLARHIWISTRIPERNHITESVLAECEKRLETAGAEVHQ